SSPIFLKYMLSDDYSLESLKWIGSSGNKVTKDLVERANSRFGRPIVSNLYGSTETDMTTCAPPEVVLRDPSIVGMPSPGIQVLVHDGNGNKVPTGRIGQIAMKSPMMLDEYTNPDKEPPYVPNTGGMINMGDMGFYDSEGYLHVVGRSDSMIIVGGENVHPESVTEVIEKHPHIKEAFAIGVDDPEKFQRIAAIVVTDGSSVTEDDVRDWVDDNLASHSIPRDVYFTDSLPRNAMGKVMINEVKQLIDRMA
ncbi:MAG: AMP-binding protein, partial [Corynebacterium sp.]|nr:AMP-binding protein [Corynebacterium sp.]